MVVAVPFITCYSTLQKNFDLLQFTKFVTFIVVMSTEVFADL